MTLHLPTIYSFSIVEMREFQKLRAEALEESKRQAEIYKSMGPAGGQNATLVERMLAKGAKAAEKGAKVKGGKQDPSAQRPVDFEPFSVVERDGETYLQIPGTRQSSRTEAQERIRVDFEVLSSSKS
ncbi:hypothetical protein FRC17_009956 [Serendipita sp. 399]|nr:hypothetical protein FRC17_009956 [Serendipita sp. 399]